MNCLDGFMNIAMENCEESFGERVLNSYKSIFIRGNNGKFFIQLIKLNALVLYITLI